MLRRIKKVFKRGTKCKQCRDYDKCYELQVDYNHYNTLNAPACEWFEECEEIEDIEEFKEVLQTKENQYGLQS